jgi:hypothetical protein
MSVTNHSEHFRPLRGGIVIVAATRQSFGTLGMVATSDGTDRWGLTCAHVLGPLNGTVPTADPVFQPDTSVTAFRVGHTVTARSDQGLDCAAFLIDSAVLTTGEILGIGAPQAPTAPAVGMRVVKSGRSTGITEGVVDSVAGGDVRIKLRADFPGAYELSEPGDSGAIWCDLKTRAPLALHRSGSSGIASVAVASDLRAVLAALSLRPLP